MDAYKYILYLNPIGAAGPERTEFTKYEAATECFANACSPLLYIEAWLLYVVGDSQFGVLKHWHRSEEQCPPKKS